MTLLVVSEENENLVVMNGRKRVYHFPSLKIQGWLQSNQTQELIHMSAEFGFSWLGFLCVSFIFRQALPLGGKMTISISGQIAYLLSFMSSGKRISAAWML